MSTEMQSRIEAINHIPWVSDGPGYYFIANPLVINAAPDIVWEVVKDILGYDDYSDGAITASLPQGELKVGNFVHFEMYGNQCSNKLLASDEEIKRVDDDQHVLMWAHTLPGKAGLTECYRVLEPQEDGTTKSYIALKIPGFLGFFTQAMWKRKIENAFNQLNQGIKRAAEEKQASMISPMNTN